MGTPYHHYIVGDDWITPPGSEAWFSEKILRLPCYQPNDRKRVVETSRPTRAHTTASDALWMGVPMITISGRAFASRVCGSLVRAAGLPELVCETEADYIELAVALAGDRARIAALKARLSRTRDTCDLFNMEQLASRLEALYGEMVADHRAGRLPSPDLTNLEAYMAVGCDFDHEGHDLMAAPDYADIYRAGLARRHLVRPLKPDGRLWAGEPKLAANETGLPKSRVRRSRAS